MVVVGNRVWPHTLKVGRYVHRYVSHFRPSPSHDLYLHLEVKGRHVLQGFIGNTDCKAKRKSFCRPPPPLTSTFARLAFPGHLLGPGWTCVICGMPISEIDGQRQYFRPIYNLELQRSSKVQDQTLIMCSVNISETAGHRVKSKR